MKSFRLLTIVGCLTVAFGGASIAAPSVGPEPTTVSMAGRFEAMLRSIDTVPPELINRV